MSHASRVLTGVLVSGNPGRSVCFSSFFELFINS